LQSEQRQTVMMRKGKICEVTIYCGITKIKMKIKSSIIGKKLLAAAVANLNLPYYKIYALVDEQSHPLKMDTSVWKQLRRNDPTIKIITLYHSTETCPLMDNDALVAIQYAEAIENLICGKIFSSYENFIELIAIAFHERWLAQKGTEWQNILWLSWLMKRFRVNSEKCISDIAEKICEHSFKDNIQAMKCFLAQANNACTFSNHLIFTASDHALIGMNTKGMQFYIENNMAVYINWSQVVSVKKSKKKVTVKYVEKRKSKLEIMFNEKADAKSFVKFSKMLRRLQNIEDSFYPFNIIHDRLESRLAGCEMCSAFNRFIKYLTSLDGETLFFDEENCESNKKTKKMKKPHTDLKERKRLQETKKLLRIIKTIFNQQGDILRALGQVRTSFNKQKDFVNLKTKYYTYKKQFIKFKRNVMKYYMKKTSEDKHECKIETNSQIQNSCNTVKNLNDQEQLQWKYSK
ncbi:hypothetical protein T11_198, partial [Trichinella zimbabwensis]